MTRIAELRGVDEGLYQTAERLYGEGRRISVHRNGRAYGVDASTPEAERFAAWAAIDGAVHDAPETVFVGPPMGLAMVLADAPEGAEFTISVSRRADRGEGVTETIGPIQARVSAGEIRRLLGMSS